jgi:hypothetical protein
MSSFCHGVSRLPYKEEPTTNYIMSLMKNMHHDDHYAPQHLKMASDRVKACHNRLFNSAGSRKKTNVW